MYWLVGIVLGGWPVPMLKKKKAKINFWSTKYLTVLDAFFKVDSSDLDTCSFIKG